MWRDDAKTIISELFPHVVRQSPEYNALVQAASTGFAVVFNRIENLPLLRDADKIPARMLEQLEAEMVISNTSRLSIFERRELVKRYLQYWRNRGATQDLLREGQYAHNESHLGGGLFNSYDNPDFNLDGDDCNLEFPRDVLFRHSRHPRSTKFRYPNGSRYLDGVILFQSEHLDQKTYDAVIRVKPAGMRLLFEILVSLGGYYKVPLPKMNYSLQAQGYGQFYQPEMLVEADPPQFDIDSEGQKVYDGYRRVISYKSELATDSNGTPLVQYRTDRNADGTYSFVYREEDGKKYKIEENVYKEVPIYEPVKQSRLQIVTVHKEVSSAGRIASWWCGDTLLLKKKFTELTNFSYTDELTGKSIIGYMEDVSQDKLVTDTKYYELVENTSYRVEKATDGTGVISIYDSSQLLGTITMYKGTAQKSFILGVSQWQVDYSAPQANGKISEWYSAYESQLEDSYLKKFDEFELNNQIKKSIIKDLLGIKVSYSSPWFNIEIPVIEGSYGFYTREGKQYLRILSEHPQDSEYGGSPLEEFEKLVDGQSYIGGNPHCYDLGVYSSTEGVPFRYDKILNSYDRGLWSDGK